MNAQEFLTQLIAGFEAGSIVYLIVSFVLFSLRRAAAQSASAATDAHSIEVDVDLPELPELFARADAIGAEHLAELPTAKAVPESIAVELLPQALESPHKPLPLAVSLEGMDKPIVKPQLPSIRELKQRAKAFKIPRYGSMTQSQLLEVPQLA